MRHFNRYLVRGAVVRTHRDGDDELLALEALHIRPLYGSGGHLQAALGHHEAGLAESHAQMPGLQHPWLLQVHRDGQHLARQHLGRL